MWWWWWVLLSCGVRLGAEPVAPEPRQRKAPQHKTVESKGTVYTPYEETPKGDLSLGPDLLFVTWDTTRADHTSLYGYPRDTTPTLVALAEDSIVFDRFIVPMSTTLPSHTSMFTGVRPEEHGILANVSETGERFIPSEALKTLPDFLRQRGYATAGFVSSAPLKVQSGISAGFEHFDQPRNASRRASLTTDAALAWLRAQPEDVPVFVWVHYYDPHSPYEAVPELTDHFKADETLFEVMRERHYASGSPEEARMASARLNAYDADILYTDGQFARLMRVWQRSGRLQRTAVVVAGDHGEGLGQHQHMEHGLTWNEQLHAPLLMRLPDRKSRRVARPIGANDLLPTLLGAIDLPEEEVLLSQVSGVDVLADDHDPQPVFSRSSVRHQRLGRSPSFTLTGQRYKLVVNADGKTSLYDLRKDPYERNNVADRQAARVERMRAYGRASLAEQRARAEELGAGGTEQLDETSRAELEELGYLE